jgi:hypothetical protein
MEGRPVNEPVTYEPPVLNAALVVGPDDQLVVSLSADTSAADLEMVRDVLHEQLGNRFVIFCGVEQIAVVRHAAPGDDQ